MATQPINGVEVWAHTGRGLMLSDTTQSLVLGSWREALPDNLVIAGVGARDVTQPDDGTARTLQMAEKAARLGADALLIYPPTWLREHPLGDQLILAHHKRVAEIGLPLILFYLYEDAGGVTYRPNLLDELLSLPEVVAVKIATLDSVMTFQDVAHQIQSRHPEKLLLTGEDRFLGYSLMRGAQAALIGMGAVCTDLQVQLMNAHFSGDAQRFLALSKMIDRLAEVLFVQPMEGYIGRILVALAHLEIIPTDATNDPFGPQLSISEIEEIRSVVNSLTLASVS